MKAEIDEGCLILEPETQDEATASHIWFKKFEAGLECHVRVKINTRYLTAEITNSVTH